MGTLSRKEGERKVNVVNAFRRIFEPHTLAERLPVQVEKQDSPVLHSLIQLIIHATNINCKPSLQARWWTLEDSGNKVDADSGP